MVNVNDLKNGMSISFDNNIYTVLENQHVKPGKGPAFVRTKLRNLRTNSIIEHTFNAGIKVAKAHIDRPKMQYLYESGQEYFFMNLDTYDQLSLRQDQIGDDTKYLKEGLEVEMNFFEGELLGITVPEKIEVVVTKTEPGVKGNTTSGAMKDAVVETGLLVKVPLFINEGETIIISTKDGKYSGRK